MRRMTESTRRLSDRIRPIRTKADLDRALGLDRPATRAGRPSATVNASTGRKAVQTRGHGPPENSALVREVMLQKTGEGERLRGPATLIASATQRKTTCR